MGENKCFVLGFKEEITTQQEKNKESWEKKKKKQPKITELDLPEVKSVNRLRGILKNTQIYRRGR